ncbi:Trm112 family protein [Sphingomonas sp.]|jgi:uncharacterized protein YbaR (Trm112 family)|uniref:Trm112 family protein n=1 Tax=Sphingomonas sp. TaxID=28214 RepID=UPI0035C7F359
MSGRQGAPAFDPWLLERLVCPVTRTPLRQLGDELISDAAGLAYPVREGVPVLLAEAARRLDAAPPADQTSTT